MKQTNFKIGDKIIAIDCCGVDRDIPIGTIGKVSHIYQEGDIYSSFNNISDGEERLCSETNGEKIRIKKVGNKRYKPKPEDLTRFIAYGQGCDNTSKLFLTEPELREEMKKRSIDRDWTGRIIGYKLVPLFEAEQRIFLNKIKPLKNKV